VSVDNAHLCAESRRLAVERGPLRPVAALVTRGAESSEVVDAITEEARRPMPAASAGLPCEASRRPLLIDSLLYGRILDQWTVWEIANQLRLPSQGPFVVVAAELPVGGKVALPDIESKLCSLDVYSAWRVLPDVQVGIVHIKSDQHLEKIVALLSRTTTGRAGVSARFDDLRDTPPAFHVAKVTLRSRAQSASLVSVFDGSILATAAVSAPEVMVKSAATLLNGFDDLSEGERQLLFETFRVWQESDSSVCTTAEVLFCHPNTVRYRLRRIEQRTGRSLSSPRDIAELCLAFEVQRLLK
jgi:PucR C-terminal helix-turn-helix domain/GGDEF-like domain